ncbi:MAG: hypothetical protein R2801_08885 [Chitinophagales bacterium]
MKNLIFITINLCIVTLFAGNEDQIGLTKDFNAYFNVIDKVESIDEYLYPELFNIIPKTTLQMAVKDLLNDSTIKTSFLDSKITSIEKVISYDGVKYAKLNYSYLLKLTFLEADFEDENGTITNIYKSKYGKENVVYDATTKTYSILLNNTMVAIWKPDYNHWKFVEAKPETKEVFKLIFPENIIKKLKL